MALTFCIGDLLGKPRTPPDLLKEPCESCGKEEAKHTTYGDSVLLSGRLEQIRVCTGCLPHYEPCGLDE